MSKDKYNDIDKIILEKQETREKKEIMGHCSKCSKYSVVICIPCALRLRDKAKQNWEKEIENLIAQEINIANCHNQSTSRLTHLAVKISKLNSK